MSKHDRHLVINAEHRQDYFKYFLNGLRIVYLHYIADKGNYVAIDEKDNYHVLEHYDHIFLDQNKSLEIRRKFIYRWLNNMWIESIE